MQVSIGGAARLVLVAALLTGLPGRAALAGSETFTGEVVGVADGDTLSVLRDRTPVKIRLHGIDAPEKTQAFGEKARQLTSSLVFGKSVRVEVVTRDKYGRTVALVHFSQRQGIDHFEDGRHAPVDVWRCLNEELLKAGLAWWYRAYSPKERKLEQLEREARQARRGLWAEASPTPPWEFRHPELLCQKDDDCVFLPPICAGCPPGRPTPRAVGNRQALLRIVSLQARARCARPPRCPPPSNPKNWLGGKLVCAERRCTLQVQKPLPAAAPAAAVYHGNTGSKVLHAPGCQDYRCKHCTAGFASLEQARQAGYRPHRACTAPFEQCFSACRQRNMARATGWQGIEAECRKMCTR